MVPGTEIHGGATACDVAARVRADTVEPHEQHALEDMRHIRPGPEDPDVLQRREIEGWQALRGRKYCDEYE